MTIRHSNATLQLTLGLIAQKSLMTLGVNGHLYVCVDKN